MIFNNYSEAKKWFRNYHAFNYDEVKPRLLYSSLLGTENDISKPFKFGDYILFQHVKSEYPSPSFISRPILAVFLEWQFWDQALVINFVENTRAWEQCNEVITNPELNIKQKVNCLDKQTEQIQFWTDDIVVLGYWENRPKLSDIKHALTLQIK